MPVSADAIRIQDCQYLHRGEDVRGCGGRYRRVNGEAVQRMAQNGNGDGIDVCGPINDQIKTVREALTEGRRVESNGNGEVVVFLNLE